MGMAVAQDEVTESLEQPVQGVRSSARCRQCSGSLSGFQITRVSQLKRCAGCSAALEYRKWAYTCEDCEAVMCRRCVAADRGNPGLPLLDTAQSPPVVDLDDDRAGQLEDVVLLDLLRQLPEAFPRAPMLWVPRRLRRQVGAMLRSRVDEAVKYACCRPGDVSAEVAHRLCRAAPQLLLRAPPDSMTSDEAGDGVGMVGPAATQEVKQRVRLALQGEWMKLVEMCLSELDAARQAHRQTNALHARNSVRDDAGRLTVKGAQSATLKARTASLRGAAAVLTGGPQVPPGPATDSAVQGLFRTDPLSPSETSQLGEALEAAAAIPKRKRLRMTLRLVGHQVATIRLAAAPGPSGWRNSYIHCLYSDPNGPRVLAAWAAAWAQGSTAPCLAQLWNCSLARPF